MVSKAKSKTIISKKKRTKSKSKINSIFKFKPVWEIYTLEGCSYCKQALILLKNNKQIVDVKDYVTLKPKQKKNN